MSGAKYTYAVEVEHQHQPGQWMAIFDSEQRGFCVGYLAGAREVSPPRLAKRVVRSDGLVIDTSGAADRVGIGMVAGFPTPEQYERAAERALETAARLREIEARRRKRGPS